jgi:phosphoglycerate dehydrogenase-like enzyme
MRKDLSMLHLPLHGGKLKIVLTWPEDDPDCLLAKIELRRRLGESNHHIIAPKTSKLAELMELVRDADILAGQDMPREVVDEAKKARLIQVVHTGVSELGLDFDSLKKRGIVLGNVTGNIAISVAEDAIALTLALAKRLVRLHNAATSGRWTSYFAEGEMSTLLLGRTLGIVGLGRIGLEIASRAKAFGMTILAIKKPKTPKADVVDFQGLPADLDKLLSESDFLILCSPVTRETIGLIGERELKLMKPTAYLINVSRASLVEERPLARALREGWIAGYASDVWFSYPHTWGWYAPVLSREGIHLMDNVIVNPDRAGANPDVRNAMIANAMANIEAFVNGKNLLSQVNLDEGF